TIEVERSLRVLDGAVAGFCSVGGGEPQTQTVWPQADKYSVPRNAFLNKVNRLRPHFERGSKVIDDGLGARPVALQMPIGSEEKFAGIIELVQMKAVIWEDESLGAKFRVEAIPESMIAEARQYHDKLLEVAADCDESIMEKYLEGKEISKSEL